MKAIHTQLVFVLLAIGFVIQIAYFNNTHLVSGDPWGYYSYLPAALVYNDLGDYQKTVAATKVCNNNFIDQEKEYYGLYHLNKYTGKKVCRYPCGIAVMLLPAFVLTHVSALLFATPVNCFSPWYNFGMSIGVFIWVILGTWYLYKLLSKYYSSKISFATVLLIYLGTNVYYNTVFTPVMSHALLYSLYAILLYIVDIYYLKPSIKYAIIIGVMVGLILLVRNIEIFTLPIIILWAVNNKAQFMSRLQYIKSNYKRYILMAIVALIIFSPQLLY
jgi:hypothetical protein